jgi:serine/threonine-protein kinase
VDSLSTPAGVDCIAADVRLQVAATPRSGTHRAMTRPPIQARADTSRQAPDDVRPVQTPATPAPPMFGAGETAEMPVQPGIGRNWIAIGVAAAGLILVVGVPSIWLLTRSTTPKPVAAAADARPAASEIAMDPTPAGPPPPAAPVNTGRGAGARTAAQGAALATPPGGSGANAAQPPAANPADAGARGGAAAPPAAPPAVPVGRISVTAPLSMLINEKGYQLGVSPGNAIPLPVGRHDIELVNESIGFRETRSVEVTAGRTTPIVVTLPKGTVSFNAIPWAEVWADGQKIGETPVANVEMAAGPHEVSFRHPQLGERRLTVVVPVNGPQRVSMDMRKQ